jgi:hypothetical protein
LVIILFNVKDVHYGLKLVNVEIKDTVNGTRRYATFRDMKSGEEHVMDFGTLLLTPEQKPRDLYKDSGLTDENVN